MQVLNETIEQDGSAWTAIVNVRGVLFRAGLVANRLQVGRVPYKFPPRTPRWAEKAVREWAEKRVAQLPAEWMAKHREMYAAA